jgi:hypothetical protein
MIGDVPIYPTGRQRCALVAVVNKLEEMRSQVVLVEQRLDAVGVPACGLKRP